MKEWGRPVSGLSVGVGIPLRHPDVVLLGGEAHLLVGRRASPNCSLPQARASWPETHAWAGCPIEQRPRVIARERASNLAYADGAAQPLEQPPER